MAISHFVLGVQSLQLSDVGCHHHFHYNRVIADFFMNLQDQNSNSMKVVLAREIERYGDQVQT